MKYALIDMGSNSIRLTAFDIGESGFKVLFKEKIMAGLAGYVEHERLTQDGIDCACRSLNALYHTLTLLEIENLAVFATASLRNISNTAQAVEQIRRVTGLTVEVLSGAQEAEYGFYGAAGDAETDDGLFADIGGASAELALFTGRQLRQAVSVPVGSLKLYRDCVKNILPGKASRLRMEKVIAGAFDSDAVKALSPAPHMVCVGGTVRAVLRLIGQLYGLDAEERSFTSAQLAALVKQLYKGDKNAADLILRYEPERIHTLVPGVMILWYLVNRFGVERITVSQYGLREGYLLRKIQPGLGSDPRAV